MSPDVLRAAARALAAAADDPELVLGVDAEALQDLLGAATRVYAARREAGAPVPAFRADGAVAPPTATDVVVTVSAMLDGAGVELFELGLWQTWAGGAA